jgi:hypothetical protein
MNAWGKFANMQVAPRISCLQLLYKQLVYYI